MDQNYVVYETKGIPGKVIHINMKSIINKNLCQIFIKLLSLFCYLNFLSLREKNGITFLRVTFPMQVNGLRGEGADEATLYYYHK